MPKEFFEATDDTAWEFTLHEDGGATLVIAMDPPLVVDEVGDVELHDITLTLEPRHVEYLRGKLG